MKVLITGAPGWLGSQLAESVLRLGWIPKCLVHPSVDATALAKNGALIARGDLTKPASLEGICNDISTVFHCAGMIHPQHPKDFFRVNTGGTANLANEAIRSNVKQFVYVSSSSAGVSGFGSPRVVDESDADLPYRLYGRSKWLAEQLLMELHHKGLLNPVILRPHWLYGPGAPKRQDLFIGYFNRERPLMFGDGNNLRSLCDVRNCLQALILAGQCQKTGVFYIADSEPYTLDQIYRWLGSAASKPCETRHIPIPDRSSRLYDLLDLGMQRVRYYRPGIHWAWEWSKNIATKIEKARTELGYAPTFTFRSFASQI
jgi:nucleoside-diphosphate-sugar epimerase